MAATRSRTLCRTALAGTTWGLGGWRLEDGVAVAVAEVSPRGAGVDIIVVPGRAAQPVDSAWALRAFSQIR